MTTKMNYGTAKQPKPDPFAIGPDCWELVMDEFAAVTTPIDFKNTKELVLEDMRGRSAYGLEFYKHPLRPHDGRDVMMDPYQEALDLAVYLRKAIAEGNGWAVSMYKRTLEMLLELRTMIAMRDDEVERNAATVHDEKPAAVPTAARYAQGGHDE